MHDDVRVPSDWRREVRVMLQRESVVRVSAPSAGRLPTLTYCASDMARVAVPRNSSAAAGSRASRPPRRAIATTSRPTTRPIEPPRRRITARSSNPSVLGGATATQQRGGWERVAHARGDGGVGGDHEFRHDAHHGHLALGQHLRARRPTSSRNGVPRRRVPPRPRGFARACRAAAHATPPRGPRRRARFPPAENLRARAAARRPRWLRLVIV